MSDRRRFIFSFPFRCGCPASFLACSLLATTLAVGAEPLPEQAVQPAAFGQIFSADAQIEAVRQATVAAQVAGRVVDVRVDAGQRVQAGQLLMKIDAREANEAAAAAAAQLANARVTYQRQRNLRQQGFISQAALDKAKADFDTAQAAHSQAQISAGHATVRSPLSGVVAQRLTELGEMANPGKPLFLLYDPAGLRVTASVPQQRLPQLRALQQAKVEFPELASSVVATSVNVLPIADAATHVSPVRVGLPAGMGGLLPGMHARVHFQLASTRKLGVPTAAIVRRGEVAAVYVRNAQGQPVLRQLRLGEPLADGSVEVLAGLHAGERVILDPVRAAIESKAASPSAR
ncbi:MAG TPA: efflux RND transporter periplasmic adaptor subunit [Accumulibacter sp.]|nr:efflux RND transporter periplasmic adaptor subunit [Accumulibacter sp.]